MNETKKPLLPEMLQIWQNTLSWQPDAGHLLEFQRLYELILEGNQQLNLTRITQPRDFWEKHLWDGLRGVSPLWINADDWRVIDIGTGAGFPGLPVAIARPDWQITLLDSTGKKTAFVQSVIDKLGMENAVTITGRAEEIGRQPQHRATYDLALTRALAPAPTCAEYALPLLKIGGLAVLYRGHWTDADTENLTDTVTRLGGIVDFIERFSTPLTKGERHCIYLRKVAGERVTEFPRRVSPPDRHPLSPD